jgi:hypothetical protein
MWCMPRTRPFDLLAPSARGVAGRQRADYVRVHHGRQWQSAAAEERHEMRQ